LLSISSLVCNVANNIINLSHPRGNVNIHYIFSSTPFGSSCHEVSPCKGLALKDAISKTADKFGGGTDIKDAVDTVNKKVKYDRLIMITDEQSCTDVPDAKNDKSYIMNVAAYQHGIDYGSYIHINGFSKNIIKFIQEYEKLNLKKIIIF
jgi:hypothetical protein